MLSAFSNRKGQYQAIFPAPMHSVEHRARLARRPPLLSQGLRVPEQLVELWTTSM